MNKKDVELLAWLENQQGVNLVSDDDGRWAVSGDGFQPIPEEGGFSTDVSIVTFVDPTDWRPTIGQAIEAAISKQRQEMEE